MLGDKHRMAAHWRLLAVVSWGGRRKTLRNKIFCVTGKGFRAFINAILALFRAEAETHAKRGARKALEKGVKIGHCITSGWLTGKYIFPLFRPAWQAEAHELRCHFSGDGLHQLKSTRNKCEKAFFPASVMITSL